MANILDIYVSDTFTAHILDIYSCYLGFRIFHSRMVWYDSKLDFSARIPLSPVWRSYRLGQISTLGRIGQIERIGRILRVVQSHWTAQTSQIDRIGQISLMSLILRIC